MLHDAARSHNAPRETKFVAPSPLCTLNESGNGKPKKFFSISLYHSSCAGVFDMFYSPFDDCTKNAQQRICWLLLRLKPPFVEQQTSRVQTLLSVHTNFLIKSISPTFDRRVNATIHSNRWNFLLRIRIQVELRIMLETSTKTQWNVATVF